MKNASGFDRRWTGLLLFAALILPSHTVSAQSGRGLALGFGLGRFVPLNALATADGEAVEYKLKGAGASFIAIDYWYTRWLGTRLAYQWVRPEMAEPEGPSYARLYSGQLAALIAPVQIGRRAKPFLIAGAGLRRYDVNALVTSGDIVWDIAPRQNRVAGYGGAGVIVRAGSTQILPEVGAFTNSFRHQFPCQNCSDQRDGQLDLLLTLQIQIASQRR
ncbi:MAG: hypothetical protein ACRENP_23920 [Longimicrobiales bacterium]